MVHIGGGLFPTIATDNAHLVAFSRYVTIVDELCLSYKYQELSLCLVHVGFGDLQRLMEAV